MFDGLDLKTAVAISKAEELYYAAPVPPLDLLAGQWSAEELAEQAECDAADEKRKGE